MRSKKDYFLLALKGAGMGAANVIPGVSGGTIAFLTGIFQELVDSLKSFDGNAVKLFFTGKFKEFWKTINGNFLLAVGIGVLVSIFSLAKLMELLLEKNPIEVWSFFFGLILVSIYYLAKEAKGVKVSHLISGIVGIAFGAFICLVSPSETPDALWFIFLCGAIGMCTMILPGISGSFVLLLLGKYDYIISAVSELNIPVLAVFGVGAVIGILAFSHLLSWMYKKFYNGTVLFLSGLMLGSLIKVWPWKTILASGVDRPVMPGSYVGDPHLASAVICMAIGVALVVVLNVTAVKKGE